MKRLATLIVLGLCALPGMASVPAHTGKTKPTHRQAPAQQLPVQPAMQIPPTIPQPQANADVLEVVQSAQRLLVDFMLGRVSRASEGVDPLP